MIKKYLASIVFLLFFFINSGEKSYSQVTATPDYGEIQYNQFSQMVIPDVLANDLVDGQPATLSNVTVSEINTNDINVSVENNGQAWHTPGGFDPAATHITFYRVTSIVNPVLWDIAAVTLNVGGCLVASPVITNVVEPTCSSEGSLTLTGLPQTGTYQITMWRNGVQQSVTDHSGSTLALTGLWGICHFSVSVGTCRSLPVKATLYSDCGLLIGALGNYADFNNDGIVNAGDVVNYQITVFNGKDVPITGVTITAPDSPLMQITGEPIDILYPDQSDSTTYSGVRILTQPDIDAGYVSDAIDGLATDVIVPVFSGIYAVTYFSTSPGLKLRAFADLNGNGFQDGDEYAFTGGHFEYIVNNDGITHSISASGGTHYLFESDPSASYDISYVPDDTAYFTSTSAYSDISIAAGSGITTLDFAVTIVPHHDLSVSLSAVSGLRPGLVYINQITIRNQGTFPESGTLTFTKDTALSMVSAADPAAIITPTGLTFSFTDLLPNEYKIIELVMQVPALPGVAIGDILINAVSITVPGGDIHPENNAAQLAGVVRGSYDPNQKTEAHGGTIDHAQFTSDDDLTYTIRFENTGTADAINIRVSDVLDDSLDASTVRMIASSHDYVLERIGGSLTWKFDAIDLPPSIEGSQTGHGFVTFRVKPKPGYAVGDIIPNMANIYFDTNPAIATAICNTEFVSTLANSAFEKNTVAIWPNPTASAINVRAGSGVINLIIITDISGKTVLSKNANGNAVSIDVSTLAKGSYFVKALSQTGSQTLRFIKN